MCNSILVDPSHPLFKDFPTESHTNWQWWDILRNANPMILDQFGADVAFPKDYRPLIQAIDSWKINRKLALLAECRLEGGSLMISSIDFEHDMGLVDSAAGPAERPATRLLYGNLLRYMNSPDFAPQTEITLPQALSILKSDPSRRQQSTISGSLPDEG